MNQDQFISKYSDAWHRLEALLKQIEKKGLKKLGSKAAQEYLHLFRQTSHHLAYSKTQYPNSDLYRYLNNLIAKCQGYTYGVKRESFKAFWHYLVHGYPQLIRENISIIGISTALFMVGAVVAGLLVALNPEFATLFLPVDLVEGIKSNTMGSNGKTNFEFMSSFVMTNNIKVSLFAFVLGLTAGLGTLYVLFLNGTILGALTVLVYQYSDPLKYWSLIIPHGFLELTAIFIAGASGLIIARGMLLPGDYTRIHSIIAHAKKATALLLGVCVMLVLAGIIEGFITPQPIGPYPKLVFAFITLPAIIIYILAPWSKGTNRTSVIQS